MAKRHVREAGQPPYPFMCPGRRAAVALAFAAGVAACGVPQPIPQSATAQVPTTRASASSPVDEASYAQPRGSVRSLTDPSQFQSPPARAVAILKTSANWYRDRFDQGHQYLVAGDTDRFETWWNIMNQGSLLATAQNAFGDAADVYGGNEPQPVDDWSVIMGDQGELQAAANAWHASQTDADYAKVLAALDHADRTIDALAPGITIPRSHGKIAVPMPYAVPRS